LTNTIFTEQSLSSKETTNGFTITSDTTQQVSTVYTSNDHISFSSTTSVPNEIISTTDNQQTSKYILDTFKYL
jgi:hypothetical protein